MIDPLTALEFAPPLTTEFYSRSYKLRKEASTMTDEAIQWLRGHASLMTQNSLREKKPLSILSVGSGEGDIDLAFIEALRSHLPPSDSALTYTALEPNQEHREKFVARIEESQLDDSVRISVSSKLVEEWEPKPESYDLVLMIHVLYDFENPTEIIRQARRMTRPGGSVVIIHQTAEGIPQIQRLHMLEVKGDVAEMLDTSDIQQLLLKAELPFTLEEIDANLDVSDCLRQTEDGIQIMSFCMECDLRPLNFIKFNRVLQSFRKHAEKREDGADVIREPIGIFTIPKLLA